MSLNYGKIASTKQTPQSEPITGSKQVKNNAGGYSFAIDDWKRAERFLILGSEGGTYYVGERKLTLDNAQALSRCVAQDGVKLVQLVTEISDKGRAPKNDPALFALAIACRQGDAATKQAAYQALGSVARIGTHLFHWAEYMKQLGGLSGNGAKRAIGRWYSRPAIGLALQAMKYQQRDGWSHRDMLRLSHPKAPSDQHAGLFNWMVKGWPEIGAEPHPDEVLRKIWAFEKAKLVKGKELVKLISDYDLPHECVPNEAKDDPAIWEAMLPSMGITALIRNLGKMTSVGLLAPLSKAEKAIKAKLGDADQLKRGRVHPLSVLMAIKVYAQGHGDKGKLSWSPVQSIVDALDSAFYSAFQAVEPTGKRLMLAVDISGSMDGGSIAGMNGITPRVGAAAMALVTQATEPSTFLAAYDTQFTELRFSPKTRLDEVVAHMQRMHMGGTDCAVPIVYATQRKIQVDAFISYTDNETWAGPIHPIQALKVYRDKMGIPAKLIAVGMTATEMSIADPDDTSMLDVCGFDAGAPAVMSSFIAD